MDFPEMRRQDRILDRDEALQIMNGNRLGYLGLISPTGYPYVVPMNYVYQDETVYLHCAQAGHKIDCLSNHPEVCFTVVGDWQIVPEHTTTVFESVIAFGKAVLIEDISEKAAALRLLIKHSGVNVPLEKVCTPTALEKTAMIAIRIEHITGKRRPIPRD